MHKKNITYKTFEIKDSTKEIWKEGDDTYQNCTSFWSAADNEDRWKQNIHNSNTKKLLDDLGWTENNITYKFNEWGYRSDSFDQSCDIAFAGCSMTFSEGVPLEKSWPYMVAKQMSANYHNLAVNGSDWSQLVQRVFSWIDTIKPKCLIVLSPPIERFSWKNKNKDNININNIAREHVRKAKKSNQLLFSTYQRNKIRDNLTLLEIVENEVNYNWWATSYYLLLKLLCKEKNIKFFAFEKQPLVTSNGTFCYCDEKSRDLQHDGIDEHQKISQYVIDQINLNRLLG